jgi:hypothetical protein
MNVCETTVRLILSLSIFSVLMFMNLLGVISQSVLITFNRQITKQSNSVTSYTFMLFYYLGYIKVYNITPFVVVIG